MKLLQLNVPANWDYTGKIAEGTGPETLASSTRAQIQ